METIVPHAENQYIKQVMNKLTNLKYPLKYTSTDFIAYTGELPDCLPSSTSTCNPMDRSLTKLFQLLLERYCEPSANPLDADISELDIECLLEANPDIEIGDDLTLKDLLIYYKEHLCEIYDRLCAECGGETDLNCTITKPKPCTNLRRFRLVFPEEINYFYSELESVDLIITLPGNSDGSPKVFTIPSETSVSDLIAQITAEWDNPEFVITSVDTTIYFAYQGLFASPIFSFSITYSDPSSMVTTGNIDDIDFDALAGVLNAGAASTTFVSGNFKWLGCDEEVSGLICDFIQDHEDRITELENAPSADPYVPEPLVIPINKFLNLQSQSEILLNIAPYIKYKTPEYYFSKTPDGAKLDSLVNNLQSELGNYGRLWLDSDAQYLRYAHLISPPDTGDDYFEYYLTDASGSNYLMPISIYSVNACCSGEPSVPSGEAVLQTYVLEFDVNGWNTEGQFLDANVTITSDPSVGGETATPGVLFVLTFDHGLSLVGTYSAVAIYMENVGGAISTTNLTADTVDIELANNPFNVLGENIKIKVIITQ